MLFLTCLDLCFAFILFLGLLSDLTGNLLVFMLLDTTLIGFFSDLPTVLKLDSYGLRKVSIIIKISQFAEFAAAKQKWPG